MIKMLLGFVLLTAGIAFTIKTVREMTGKERWALTKTVGYAILCSSLAFVTMVFIVLTF